MRRWNGWGDEKIHYPLPESATRYLVEVVGEGDLSPDARFEDILDSVPSSRLPPHPSITTDPADRLHHARGQSLPDWLALRTGRVATFPDGVAYPNSAEEIGNLLQMATRTGFRLIPYGGGTSVVGHITPLPDSAPVLTLDLSRLNRLEDLDETSRLATFGCGVCGPDLEKQLNPRGFTLGHFPQSFELSTLGGWIATRSSGQQSYHYGRIEDLFAGGHLVTPIGKMDLPCIPASAAGPDLRQIILGSEGRYGVITSATVRIRSLPEIEKFYGVFFRDWEAGVNAVREIVQARIPISMARLSDAQETETTLILSGKERLVALANHGLGRLGYKRGKSLLIFGVTGDRKLTSTAHSMAIDITRRHGGFSTGTLIGKMWVKSRFLTPYLRNTLWERGYAIDTLETALPWSSVFAAARNIKEVIRTNIASPNGSKAGCLVFAHLSHVYRDGASIYTTFIFPRYPDPDEMLERWGNTKKAASLSILEHQGTISHQHGVGLDHALYLPGEKGQVGMSVLEAIQKDLDPNGILNPGKLII